MLGEGFRKDRSFVQSDMAVAVDEAARRFAIVTTSNSALLNGEDIVDLEWQSPDKTVMSRFVIETRNLEFPRTVFTTMFRDVRLAEIHARLKAMQTTPVSSTPAVALEPAATTESTKPAFAG
jgi:hypothetical protein